MRWRRAIVAVFVGYAFVFVMFSLMHVYGIFDIIERFFDYAKLADATIIAVMVMPGLFAAVLAYGWEIRPGDGHTRCGNCGYILKGLTEPRCPKCGERI